MTILTPATAAEVTVKSAVAVKDVAPIVATAVTVVDCPTAPATGVMVAVLPDAATVAAASFEFVHTTESIVAGTALPNTSTASTAMAPVWSARISDMTKISFSGSSKIDELLSVNHTRM